MTTTMPHGAPTDTFTFPCSDCGRTVKVAGGRQRWHLCLCPPWLRGHADAVAAESMRWTCAQAGHPRQHPDDLACICGTWAHHVDRGHVEVHTS